MPITQGKLKKLFHYNPHNGTLVRKTQASTNTKSSAFGLGPKVRRFESCHPHQLHEWRK